MAIAAKLDELGQPAWIGLMVLAFFCFWPLGLAILAFLIWSGRMGCRNGRGMSHWRARAEDMGRNAGWWSAPSSGNRAFDDYRTETLRRLEDEQREFQDFLQRLREAKDKAEFDQFMADRRGRSPGGAEQPQQS
jgi:hypothetical protein